MADAYNTPAPDAPAPTPPSLGSDLATGGKAVLNSIGDVLKAVGYAATNMVGEVRARRAAENEQLFNIVLHNPSLSNMKVFQQALKAKGFEKEDIEKFQNLHNVESFGSQLLQHLTQRSAPPMGAAPTQPGPQAPRLPVTGTAPPAEDPPGTVRLGDALYSATIEATAGKEPKVTLHPYKPPKTGGASTNLDKLETRLSELEAMPPSAERNRQIAEHKAAIRKLTTLPPDPTAAIDRQTAAILERKRGGSDVENEVVGPNPHTGEPETRAARDARLKAEGRYGNIPYTPLHPSDLKSFRLPDGSTLPAMNGSQPWTLATLPAGTKIVDPKRNWFSSAWEALSGTAPVAPPPAPPAGATMKAGTATPNTHDLGDGFSLEINP